MNLLKVLSMTVFAAQSFASSITVDTRYEVVSSGEKVKLEKEVELAQVNPLSENKLGFTHESILKTKYLVEVSNTIKTALKDFEETCKVEEPIGPFPHPYPLPGPKPPVNTILPVKPIHPIHPILPVEPTEPSKEELACKAERAVIIESFEKGISSLKSEALNKELLFSDEKLVGFLDSLNKLASNMKEAPLYQFAHGLELAGGAAAKSLNAAGGLNLSAGGAQDVGSFKKMLEMGQIPSSSSLPVEGLLSEFDVSESFTCDNYVCLNTSSLIYLENNKLFVQLHLNSNVTYETLERNPLNVSVVLDISGSMSALDNTDKSRLEWAKESLRKVLDQLNSEDYLSIVLFESNSEILLPTTKVEDRELILDMISGIETKGSTNLEAGLRDGYELVSENFITGYENRVILLTDANLNVGVTEDDAIVKMVGDYASENIGLSAVGIGVNFNQEFIHNITTIKGGNYQFVNSGLELLKLTRNFKFLVTPVLYNFKAKLTLNDVNAKLVKTYGVPMNEGDATQDLIDIRTLFFSEGGGAILLEYDL